MLEFVTDHSWLTLAPCLIGKGSSSNSNAAANVSTSTAFNPTITIGATTPAAEDATAFDIKALLSTPVTLSTTADQRTPINTEPTPEPINKSLLLVALGLLLWKGRGRG
jgi:hypothetical protein